jgi:hypothetical protein
MWPTEAPQQFQSSISSISTPSLGAIARAIDAARVVDDAVEDGVGVGWMADQVAPFVDQDSAE